MSIRDLIYQILGKIGEDPDREGLMATPDRVEKALHYLTSGYAQDPKKMLNGALFTEKYNEMVIVKDIDIFSLCEHHLLPFFGKAHVAYIPDKKIVTGPAYMKLGNVPTPLAVPFGLFPNKQGGSSGVLIPVWGNNDELGYFLLNGGYYFAINDHVDAQLTGDIYSRGSWALRASTRYRTRYRYSGNLDLSQRTAR